MKRAFYSLILLSSLAWNHAGASTKGRLLRFYGKHYPKIQAEYLAEVDDAVEKWAQRLCLSSEVDTMLSMIHRESHFDPYADDGLGKRRSLGYMQTREEYMPMLREFWFEQGYHLGPDDSIDTQAAFGVAEFYMQLKRSDGNILGAVRRYNGSGPKAQLYAQRVFISRRVIFGRPHFDGESHPATCKKVKVHHAKI